MQAKDTEDMNQETYHFNQKSNKLIGLFLVSIQVQTALRY